MMTMRHPMFTSCLSVVAGCLMASSLIAQTGWEAWNEDPLVRPDDNRFTPTVVMQGPLNEPMAFEVLADGRIFLIERRGGIRWIDPVDGQLKSVGYLDVNTEGNNEQGLVGMTLDPDFIDNGWIYTYYFHPEEPKAIISRWSIKDNVLIANSENVLIEFDAQRETCCHTGGGMTWDAQGNLYITIGNNTGNNQAAHTDERPGRSSWDDQRGTANTNSMEGKILRIHPEPDGTYSIPPGNLFPLTTPNTRPEIYTMGHRNAWRVSVDSKTGWIYWGEVGPDAREDSDIGPKGYDEFNQARGPGFFGWPYFVGDKAYPVMDYATSLPGNKKDARNPTNLSPNNTGLVELPPLQPSFVYYPYDASERFPEMGTGGRSATGGPIYRRRDRPDALRPWPAYFEGKWLAAELSRRAIFLIEMDEHGDYKSLERFLPDYRPVEPIDMKFGPNGDLYVLEYGGRWFQASPEAKLVRIAYEGGNRQPVVKITSNRIGGIPPMEVKLSSEGTYDADHDELVYRWEVTDAGGNQRVFLEPDPVVQIDSVGTHLASLKVTDADGAFSSASLAIVSGNAPPEVGIEIAGNQQFYFPGNPVAYAVQVRDREDGTLADGGIKQDAVAFSIAMVDASFDPGSLSQAAEEDPAAAQFPVAFGLMARANCQSCHKTIGTLVGPGFDMIAERYLNQPESIDTLAAKVVQGGRGVWGEVPMPPNALITETEAREILKYVLSVGQQSTKTPLTGHYEPAASETSNVGPANRRRGPSTLPSMFMQASYRDRGDDLAAPLADRDYRLLAAPELDPRSADETHRAAVQRFGVSVQHGGYLLFKEVDMTQVRQLAFSVMASSRMNHAGGTLEVRLGDVNGQLLGTAEVLQPDGAQGGQPRGFSRPAPIKVPLVEQPGLQDLCLVFVNQQAAEEQPLMSLSGVALESL